MFLFCYLFICSDISFRTWTLDCDHICANFSCSSYVWQPTSASFSSQTQAIRLYLSPTPPPGHQPGPPPYPADSNAPPPYPGPPALSLGFIDPNWSVKIFYFHAFPLWIYLSIPFSFSESAIMYSFGIMFLQALYIYSDHWFYCVHGERLSLSKWSYRCRRSQSSCKSIYVCFSATGLQLEYRPPFYWKLSVEYAHM